MIDILRILECNATQTIILFFTPLIPICISCYHSRKVRKEAAQVIIMQIDSIDKKVERLVETVKSKDVDEIWHAEKVIDVNRWDEKKNLFLKKFTIEQMESINKYYTSVYFILEQQERIKSIILDASRSIAYYEKKETDKNGTIKIPSRFFDTIEDKYKEILEYRVAMPYKKLREIGRM